MIPLLTTIFVASLVGSLHCAGMCGGLMILAIESGGASGERVSRARLQASYHIGRGIAYTLIGFIAGALGQAFDLAGDLAGWQRVSASAAGAGLAIFGLIQGAKALGWRPPRLPLPRFLEKAIGLGHSRAATWPPALAAGAIGLLTPLLPCGWLYAFAIAAAGTASAPLGALAMLVFWTGTLPVMVTLGAGIQSLAGSARRWAPVAASLAMILVGILTVLGRMMTPMPALPSGLRVIPTSMAEIERHIGQSAAHAPVCCDPSSAAPALSVGEERP